MAAESSDSSMLEVPLHGRVWTSQAGSGFARGTGGTTSWSNETIRRLTTLCSSAACALERLEHREEWPRSTSRRVRTTRSGADRDRQRPGQSAFVETAQLHDATFLNAVLPFALNQARRHNEPISLVCVAIDRLGGIQDLMGPDTTSGWSSGVGSTVAVDDSNQ